MKKTKIKNMFWKRKTKAVNSNPPKKEFETMLEILRVAEKYDNANEIDVRNNTLQTLVDYINYFRLKNTANTTTYLNGKMCNIAVRDRALSAGEIADIYDKKQ